MNDVIHVSDTGYFDRAAFDEVMADDKRKVTRANIHRYVNRYGKINEYFDYVDEDGVVIASGVSTNIEA